MTTRAQSLIAAALLAVLSGCASRPIPNVTAPVPVVEYVPENLLPDFRDKLLWNAMQPKLGQPPVRPRVAVGMYQRTLAFYLTETVNVIGIDETVDLLTWRTVYTDAPGLWIARGQKRVTFYSNEPTAFYRAYVRNE